MSDIASSSKRELNLLKSKKNKYTGSSLQIPFGVLIWCFCKRVNRVCIPSITYTTLYPTFLNVLSEGGYGTQGGVVPVGSTKADCRLVRTIGQEYCVSPGSDKDK